MTCAINALNSNKNLSFSKYQIRWMRILDMNMFRVITAEFSQYGVLDINVLPVMIMTSVKVFYNYNLDCYDKNL